MRDDLLRLDDAALAMLANKGLVRRARRELDAGQVPTLQLDEQATVHAHFADGTHARLPADVGLEHADCSCGATTLCRHRIAAVLAWQRQAGTAATPPPTASPGRIDEAELTATVPASSLRRANRLQSRGILIDIVRASDDDAAATARLPTASVRFLAGADLAFARCDCELQAHCEHVVLAVRAFRQADANDAAATRMRVELGGNGERTAAGWAPLQAVTACVLEHGLVAGPARHAAVLTRAIDHARTRQATWLVLTLEAIEDWLTEHAERSARFATADGLPLLAELAARPRAAEQASALAARAILGLDEPLETRLGRKRLRALGCRIDTGGGHVQARIALLDLDTATPLIARHRWPATDTPFDAERARLSGKIALPRLARGQLVATTLYRRANAEVRLGATYGGRASLSAQTGDWSGLPDATVITDLAAHHRAASTRPPAMLGPRSHLAGFAVIAITEITDCRYDPAEQTFDARCHDHAGSRLHIRRRHDANTPGALDALAGALQADTAPTHVAGMLHNDGARHIIDPWALAGPSGLCVPDVTPAGGALQHIPVGTIEQAPDPITEALAHTTELACELIHHGHRQLPAHWRTRARQHIGRLQELGLARTAGHLQQLLDALPARDDRLTDAFADLVIWLRLCAEVGSGGG